MNYPQPRPQPRPAAAATKPQPPARLPDTVAAAPQVRPVTVPPPEALGIRLDDSPGAAIPDPDRLGIKLD